MEPWVGGGGSMLLSGPSTAAGGSVLLSQPAAATTPMQYHSSRGVSAHAPTVVASAARAAGVPMEPMMCCHTVTHAPPPGAGTPCASMAVPPGAVPVMGCSPTASTPVAPIGGGYTSCGSSYAPPTSVASAPTLLAAGVGSPAGCPSSYAPPTVASPP